MEKAASRLTAKKILGQLPPTARKSILLTLLCLVVALLAAFWPSYEGLSSHAVMALFILIFCAGLWVTEAMPAFSVSLLVIGLEITLLGVNEAGDPDWQKYVATWGSPLIWLFFAGFILAAAAKKTGLDHWMATFIMSRLGSRPAVVLMGIMGSTALLSMFLSNTATATMMVAVLGPLLAAGHANNKHPRALLLGIAMGANIGGMGTIIGTPPNAIAAGALSTVSDVNFFQWMIFGVPPAAFLLSIAWGYLLLVYLGRNAFAPDDHFVLSEDAPPAAVPKIQQLLVVLVFVVTILMWITSPLHGIPTTVVSFFPICVLTTTRTLDADDVKSISWDVLLLIAGGLSLGVAVSDTGLAIWIMDHLPLEGMAPVVIALGIAYVAIFLSNLMSNTAAANVIVPLGIAILGGNHIHLIIPIALSLSAAMCLPISTPPNAIVYGTRCLKSSDLLGAGLFIGLLAPLVAIGWAVWVSYAGWVSMTLHQ